MAEAGKTLVTARGVISAGSRRARSAARAMRSRTDFRFWLNPVNIEISVSKYPMRVQTVILFGSEDTLDDVSPLAPAAFPRLPLLAGTIDRRLRRHLRNRSRRLRRSRSQRQ